MAKVIVICWSQPVRILRHLPGGIPRGFGSKIIRNQTEGLIVGAEAAIPGGQRQAFRDQPSVKPLQAFHLKPYHLQLRTARLWPPSRRHANHYEMEAKSLSFRHDAIACIPESPLGEQ